MRLDIHVHFSTDQLDRIESLLHEILTEGNRNMTVITDALDAVAVKVDALTTVEKSAVALLNGLKAALDAALALNDPAAALAAVQSISDKIGADTDELAAAVAANTGAGSATPPVGPS